MQIVHSHYDRIIKMLPPDVFDSELLKLSDDSYEAFVLSPTIASYMNDMMDQSYQLATSTMALFYHMFLMRRNGEKIFTVEPDLALMLKNTDLKGVTGDMFKTPYREQLFVLPDNMDLELYDPNTGTHLIRNIYVAYKDGELRVLAVGDANSNSAGPLDDTFSYFRFRFEEGDLRQQVRAQIGKYQDSAMLVLSGGVYNLDRIEAIFNFILNLVIYVTHPEADLYQEQWSDIDSKVKHMSGKQRSKHIQTLKQRMRYLTIRVGKNTRLSQYQRESYMNGNQQNTRTLVMGHWQHYWTGAGRTNQIHKWKRPFWRGEGELSNIPHKVAV